MFTGSVRISCSFPACHVRSGKYQTSFIACLFIWLTNILMCIQKNPYFQIPCFSAICFSF